MPLNWRYVALAPLLALLGVVAIACGDSDDDGLDDTSPPNGDGAPAPGNGDPDNGAPGAATDGSLVLDGETLVFQVAFCGFSPEETGSDSVPFMLAGAGSFDDDGSPFAINAAILDLDQEPGFEDSELGEVHVIEVVDEETFELLYTSAHAPEGDEFTIDGQQISMTAEFSRGSDGAGDIVGEGTFEADCP